MLNQALKITDKIINFVMVIFFLLLLLIGSYAFFDSYKIYDDTKLDDEILNLKPKVDENYNFEAIKKINPDIEGWITVFGTTIDYPVLHSKDNLDYLNMDFERNFSSGGSIFVDYRNRDNLNDDYTIIYGHNMMTGQMFSDIKKYADSEYFNQHLYGVLYLEDSAFKLEAIALANVNAFEDEIYNLITYSNGRNQELLNLVLNRSQKSRPVDDISKLVLLSTCDSYGSNDRTVLLARLSNTTADEILAIEEETKALISEKDSGGGAVEIFRGDNLKTLVVIVILIIIILILGRKIIEQRRKK